MKNNKKYIKLVFVLIFILNFSNICFSQIDYKRSYGITLTNLPLQDFTFFYTQNIGHNKYLELSNSFMIHKTKQISASFLLLTIKDPFSFYDLYKFRIGYRNYKNNNYYYCPMFVFNFGGFKDGYIKKYIDDKGSDAPDKDYRLSRIRYDIGAILKFGHLKMSENNFYTDIYYGFGFKVKFFNDYITEITHWPSSVQTFDPPRHDFYIKFVPTFHFGIIFGYYK